ncbi:hypothetical protein Lwal_2374 [Legionella waltersii]|uniref:Uncharacterized protein n=1 Tax=Legionella waltersii TaxID=66969 RepID=A0A0W1A5J8_9GAMM|nr:hypothetical protein Lwal_2374 [Legionella waltersii]SNU94846.1 Uncharacterised protein [Legionella waltersii]
MRKINLVLLIYLISSCILDQNIFAREYYDLNCSESKKFVCTDQQCQIIPSTITMQIHIEDNNTFVNVIQHPNRTTLSSPKGTTPLALNGTT